MGGICGLVVYDDFVSEVIFELMWSPECPQTQTDEEINRVEKLLEPGLWRLPSFKPILG